MNNLVKEKINEHQEKRKKKRKRDPKKLKNKKKLQNKIKNYFIYQKNFIRSLHQKTALFLCKNFKEILIPKFQTQEMVCNKETRQKNIQNRKDAVQTNTNKFLSQENWKPELKKYRHKRRLNRRVAYVLSALSHYSFRQYLINKAYKYD